MTKIKLNQNITVYSFDELENYITNIYLIEKKNRLYLLDTFCGPDSLDEVLEDISKIKNKELIVINTHFHWDHIWGNCCFRDEKIIAHKLCKKLMDEQWEKQINDNKKYIFGKVEKVLPNIVFENKIEFSNDGIEIFYSPGHTADSISIFDHQEKILYVGDNLEKPIVYVENKNVDRYIETLNNYLSYNPLKIYASHNLEITREDLNNTVKYLRDLKEGKEILFNSEYEKNIHQQNYNLVYNKNS